VLLLHRLIHLVAMTRGKVTGLGQAEQDGERCASRLLKPLFRPLVPCLLTAL